MSTQWQYRVVEVKAEGLVGLSGVDKELVQETLNQHGAQGWELCNAMHPPQAAHKVWLYLKKPR